jgi:hypothetical protein
MLSFMKVMELICNLLLLNGLDRGLSQMSSSMGNTLVVVMVCHFAFTTIST